MKTVTMTELMSPEDFAKDPNAKNRGVYIWGFAINSKFYPYYVGKHYTAMDFRLGEHLDDLKNGTMKVLDKKYLTDSSKFSSKDMEHCVYEHNFFKKTLGKSYAPKSALPKETRAKIQPHIDEYLKHIKICFIPVTKEHEEPSDDKPFRWCNMCERHIQDSLPGHASQLSTTCDKGFKPKIIVPSSLKHAFKNL